MACVLKVSQAWFLGLILLSYVSYGLNKAIKDKDLRKMLSIVGYFEYLNAKTQYYKDTLNK